MVKGLAKVANGARDSLHVVVMGELNLCPSDSNSKICVSSSIVVLTSTSQQFWLQAMKGCPMNLPKLALCVVDLYSSYILLGVILFAAKLGEDAMHIGWLRLQSWLPGLGHPSHTLTCNVQSTTEVLEQCLLPYLSWNVPLAAVFIAQHSLLRRPIHQVFGSQGRRVYSFTSALTLHAFMYNYRDLDVPGLSLSISSLGITSFRHMLASSAVILVSYAFFMAHDAGSWFKTLLSAPSKSACPINMDVITGMGICVYKELGWFGPWAGHF